MRLALGLSVVFGLITTVVVIQSAADNSDQLGAAGVPRAIIEGAGGFFACFGLLSRFLGLGALSIAALSVDADYRSGFIRLLSQAQPRKGVLFSAKAAAIAIVVAIMTVIASFVTFMAAGPIAGSSDFSLDTWKTGAVQQALGGVGRLFLATLAWASIGLLIATITKSAGAAIGIGVGWLLLLEPLVTQASKDIGTYLPGGTISALAQAGPAAISRSTALVLICIYLIAATIAAWIIRSRRDITD